MSDSLSKPCFGSIPVDSSLSRKMVNRDMNGFPVKKCSAFQFFKKRVRRWIKSPMVSMEKHQTSSLKYPGATVMHIPQGEPDIEVPFCQMCFNDHTFPKGIISQDSESCSWEGPRSCNVSQTAEVHTVKKSSSKLLNGQISKQLSYLGLGGKSDNKLKSRKEKKVQGDNKNVESYHLIILQKLSSNSNFSY